MERRGILIEASVRLYKSLRPDATHREIHRVKQGFLEEWNHYPKNITERRTYEQTIGNSIQRAREAFDHAILRYREGRDVNEFAYIFGIGCAIFWIYFDNAFFNPNFFDGEKHIRRREEILKHIISSISAMDGRKKPVWKKTLLTYIEYLEEKYNEQTAKGTDKRQMHLNFEADKDSRKPYFRLIKQLIS